MIFCTGVLCVELIGYWANCVPVIVPLYLSFMVKVAFTTRPFPVTLAWKLLSVILLSFVACFSESKVTTNPLAVAVALRSRKKISLIVASLVLKVKFPKPSIALMLVGSITIIIAAFLLSTGVAFSCSVLVTVIVV